MREKRDHALRDIEFQPRLVDEIARFVNRSDSIPQRWMSTAMRIWVGDVAGVDVKEFQREVGRHLDSRKSVNTAEFFNALKNQEPAKWKKAVKEFISEVQKRGVVF